MASTYPISKAIRRDLGKVEEGLKRLAAEPDGVLADACGSTLAAGGKRLRPALVLLAGTAGSATLAELMPHCLAVELIHMASLVHDDILDDAPMRRGRPSVHAEWGVTVGIAVGDYLFSKAFEVAAAAELPSAPSILAKTSVDLTEGELMQRRAACRADLARTEYLARIEKKTASLFETACRLGALASAVPGPAADALAGYGLNLGMAFQIYDDVLDVAGESDVLGKAVGADLRDGTMTLPMMFAVEETGAVDWLRGALGVDSPGAVADALAVIDRTSAAQRAKDVARDYVESAVGRIADLEPRGLRATLRDVGNYVIQRYH